jgi:hypothetical protein
VALGTLAVLHTKLGAVEQEGAQRRDALAKVVSDARLKDKSLRVALAERQEAEVKLRVLGDVVAPGELLARTMAVLERNLTKDVYLHTVQLRSAETPYTFPFLVPKSEKDLATGYETVSRTRFQRREPTVRVAGRIASGQRPAAVHQAFVQACQNDPMGLHVRPVGVLRPGGAGQDATFELEFRAGLAVPLAAEEGSAERERVVRGARLDDAENPTAIVGTEPDGTPLAIPLDAVAKDRRRDIVEELKAKAPAPAPPSGS